MRRIEYRTIPHDEHPYPTVGNYWTDADGIEQFRVSQMPDERYEHLVLIHELIERVILYHGGVPNEAVDAFDIQFEKDRDAGLHGENDEPGDDPRAPYHPAHRLATVIEMLLAEILHVDWREYEEELRKLG